jgi:hypothetical protein
MIGEMQATLTEPEIIGQAPIPIPEKDAGQASFLDTILDDKFKLDDELVGSSNRRVRRALQIMGEMSLANSILLT